MSEHGFALVFWNRRMTPMWPAPELPLAVTFSCDDLQSSADGGVDVVAPLEPLVVDAPEVVDEDRVGDAAEDFESFESLHPDSVEATTIRPSSAIRRVRMSRAPFKRSGWVLPSQRLHRQFRALFQGCHAQVSSRSRPRGGPTTVRQIRLNAGPDCRMGS
jgi:hypothetical protein